MVDVCGAWVVYSWILILGWGWFCALGWVFIVFYGLVYGMLVSGVLIVLCCWVY